VPQWVTQLTQILFLGSGWIQNMAVLFAVDGCGDSVNARNAFEISTFFAKGSATRSQFSQLDRWQREMSRRATHFPHTLKRWGRLPLSHRSFMLFKFNRILVLVHRIIGLLESCGRQRQGLKCFIFSPLGSQFSLNKNEGNYFALIAEVKYSGSWLLWATVHSISGSFGNFQVEGGEF